MFNDNVSYVPKYLLLLFLATLFYLPLSINFIHVGGKPVDITFADLFVFMLLFMYVLRLISPGVTGLELQLLFVVGACLSFFFSLAIVGAIEASSLIPVLSAFKYEKTLLALFAGMCFARFCSLDSFLRISAHASLFVFLSLCVTQFVQLGNFAPRWGEYIFSAPVYGFPNMPAQYYVILLMFFVVACIRKGNVLLYSTAALFAALFMIMGLSRGGALVLVVFSFLIFFFSLSFKSNLKLIVVLALLAPILLILGNNSSSLFETGVASKISSSLERRWDRTFSKSDPTSGRLDIAKEVLHLASDRPLLGYNFDSFSNYHKGHSTTHNQYLEALFKTGVLGLIVYFSIMFVFVWVIVRKYFGVEVDYRDKRSILIFFCALASLVVGSVTQPNFTYSQTGNVVFFMLGFLALVESR